MTRAAFAFAALLALLVGWTVVAHGRDALVVYCAHDAAFAAPLLARFEAETGIALDVRYDSEATKSLGLVELIARERSAPRCDVFWNNEALGAMQLAADGLLEPYRGPGWQRIPAEFRDAEAQWTGFAGRLRVWILGPGGTASLDGPDLSRTAVAKPLYGTTRSHYTALWQALGADGLRAAHAAWHAAGIREVPGNAQVQALVANGACDAGLTDSDDFFVAKDCGAAVTLEPVRVDGRPILVPNTVAIVRGTPRRVAAERLVDFLLGETAELALAQTAARQIPLGPTTAPLPPDVTALRDAARSAWSPTELAAARAPCLAWLRTEYLR